MHEESSYTASVYISIILAFYTIGMIILLLHFVKQKYGQVRGSSAAFESRAKALQLLFFKYH